MSQIPCSTTFHDDLNNHNLVPFVRGIYLFTQPLNDFLGVITAILFFKGRTAECVSTKAYRSAPGGSGAGGSVVIITQSLQGNPNGKILVRGGTPSKCAWGVGGGTSIIVISLSC